MRVGLRAFTTFTSRSWLNEVQSVWSKLHRMEERIFKRSLNKVELDGLLQDIRRNIHVLDDAKFEGAPPQFRSEIIIELEEEAEKISQESKRVFRPSPVQ